MGPYLVSEFVTVARKLVPCEWCHQASLGENKYLLGSSCKILLLIPWPHLYNPFKQELRWLPCQGRRLTDIHTVPHIIYLRVENLFHSRASSWLLTWKTYIFKLWEVHPDSSYPIFFIMKHHHPPHPKSYSFHNYTVSCCFCISDL